MYVKDGIVYKIINIELDMKEPVFIGMELYQDIAHRLIAHKITTSQPIINEYPGNDRIASLAIHVSNQDKPENVRLVNVKKALDGLLDNYQCYSGIRITLN
jgi:hypothetical protein